MNDAQIKILKDQLGICLNATKTALFEKYEKIFLEKNAYTNLISKKDEKFLFEKHIFDSLALSKFINPSAGQTLLDIGTGGGFPAIPLAIFYDELLIYPLDSINKKIKILEEIKKELNLDNLFPICQRVENIKEQYDFVTSRAVASLEKLINYASPKLKDGGYFIAYKSRKIDEEFEEAKKSISRSKLKILEVINYNLPLEEIYERNLIIFKKL